MPEPIETNGDEIEIRIAEVEAKLTHYSVRPLLTSLGLFALAALIFMLFGKTILEGTPFRQLEISAPLIGFGGVVYFTVAAGYVYLLRASRAASQRQELSAYKGTEVIKSRKLSSSTFLEA